MRDDVFPVLATLEEVRARSRKAAEIGRTDIAAWGFSTEDLAIVLVIEGQGILTWIDEELLASLPADALSLAKENLRRRTERPLRQRRCASDFGVWIVGEDDGLGSGRLLLHDLWEPMKATMEGELLVRIPTRSTVLCCTNRAEDMAFADHAAKYFMRWAESTGAPSLSAEWLAWTPDGWGTPEF